MVAHVYNPSNQEVMWWHTTVIPTHGGCGGRRTIRNTLGYTVSLRSDSDSKTVSINKTKKEETNEKSKICLAAVSHNAT